MSRIRRVHPTAQVLHLWAHAAQTSARNANGSVYFDGATAYSYGSHFPLGHIYRDKRGGKLVLLNSGGYSITTSTHQGIAAYAVRYLNALHVPFPRAGVWAADTKREHSENLNHFKGIIADAHAKAMRAMLPSTVLRLHAGARHAASDAGIYIQFFKLRNKAPAIPDFDAATARVDRIANPDPASADKRERARAAAKAARKLQARVRQDTARAAWRNGGGGIWSSLGDPVMLRVNGDRIQTSKGAEIPVRAAAAIWARVEQARLNQEAVVFAEDTAPRVGAFRVNRIAADGTLTAGCHVIPHAELLAMARTLNLT